MAKINYKELREEKLITLEEMVRSFAEENSIKSKTITLQQLMESEASGDWNNTVKRKYENYIDTHDNRKVKNKLISKEQMKQLLDRASDELKPYVSSALVLLTKSCTKAKVRIDEAKRGVPNRKPYFGKEFGFPRSSWLRHHVLFEIEGY